MLRPFVPLMPYDLRYGDTVIALKKLAQALRELPLRPADRPRPVPGKSTFPSYRLEEDRSEQVWHAARILDAAAFMIECACEPQPTRHEPACALVRDEDLRNVLLDALYLVKDQADELRRRYVGLDHEPEFLARFEFNADRIVYHDHVWYTLRILDAAAFGLHFEYEAWRMDGIRDQLLHAEGWGGACDPDRR
jgi:hypothetical protein